METDLEETVISIELPDLEETQIWENSNDTVSDKTRQVH